MPKGKKNRDLKANGSDLVLEPNKVYTLWIAGWVNEEQTANNIGASTAWDNPFVVYPYDNTPAMKFWTFYDYAAGHIDEAVGFANQCGGGMCMYVNRFQELLSQQVKTRGYGGGNSQGEMEWFIKNVSPSTRITINGFQYKAYVLQLSGNTDYALYRNAGTSTSNNLVTSNMPTTFRTDAFWVLMKDTLKAEYAAPKISFLTTSGTSANVYDIKKNQSENRLLKLTSGGPKFQVRWRYRILYHNSTSWSELAPIRDLKNGSYENLGWGNPWEENAYNNNTIKLEAANDLSSGTSLDAGITTPFDAVEYRWDIRSFNANGISGLPSAGQWEYMEFQTKQLPTIGTTPTITLGRDGLQVEVTHDIYRTIDKLNVTINAIKIGSKVLVDKKTFSDVSVTAEKLTLSYSWSELKFFPNDGDTAKTSISITPISNYIAPVSANLQSTISYFAGDLVPKFTITRLNDYDIKIKISESTGQAFNYYTLSYIYEHDGKTIINQLEKVAAKTFNLAMPLNSDFTLYCYMENSAVTPVPYGVNYINVTKESTPFAWKETKAVVLNSTNEEIAFTIFDDSRPVSKTKDVGLEQAKLEGAQFPNYYLTSVQDSKIDIKGAVFKKEDRHTLELLLNKGKCLLRDDTGLYCICFISSINYNKLNKEWLQCDISLVETTSEYLIVLEE